MPPPRRWARARTSANPTSAGTPARCGTSHLLNSTRSPRSLWTALPTPLQAKSLGREVPRQRRAKWWTDLRWVIEWERGRGGEEILGSKKDRQPQLLLKLPFFLLPFSLSLSLSLSPFSLSLHLLSLLSLSLFSLLSLSLLSLLSLSSSLSFLSIFPSPLSLFSLSLSPSLSLSFSLPMAS